eukprot:m.387604 g.387604  ORF g.387604 m.387604 type:complete len:691 (-) comp21033_c0_seq7:2476-4548(-)
MSLIPADVAGLVPPEKLEKLNARMVNQSGSNSATGMSNDGFDDTSRKSTANFSSMSQSATDSKRKADDAASERRNKRKQAHPHKNPKGKAADGGIGHTGGSPNKLSSHAFDHQESTPAKQSMGQPGVRPHTPTQPVSTIPSPSSQQPAHVGGQRSILQMMKSKSKDAADAPSMRATTVQPNAVAACNAEIQLWKRANERLSTELTIVSEKLEDARKERVERDKEMVLAADRYKQTIIRIVRERAQQSGRAARELCMRNTERIGFPQYVRDGINSIREQWMEGSRYKMLDHRMREIESKILQFDEQRKSIKSSLDKARRTALKENKSKDGVPGFKAPSALPAKNEYQEALEIPTLEIKALEVEKKELEQLKEQLWRDRNVHVREMRRIEDEDLSKFQPGCEGKDMLNERYVLMSLLGRGGFSEVYKAFDVVDCREVACKIHQLNTHWSEAKKENYIKHATREYEIHKDLHHENVTELYDVFEIDENSFCTVMEFCSGNDLDFVLKQHGRIPERETKCKIVQVMQALKHLNEAVDPPIIHYDLKPANILLVDGQAKLTDFGLAKRMVADDGDTGMELTSQGAGTYWYLPPECFVTTGNTPPKISSKVDVWSVGVIFYQCLYGRKPFGDGQTQQAILRHQTILNAKTVDFPTTPDAPKVSEDAQAFIRACLTHNAAHRPDVLTLAAHPYLRKK